MKPLEKSNTFVVELEACDRMLATRTETTWTLEVIGCHKLLNLLLEQKEKFGMDIEKWQISSNSGHEHLLLNELILKARGEWNFPYAHEELCHCRHVPLKVVDNAIVLGAHDPATVSRRTSASTACGTCRPDVEKIIAYRLRKAS